MINFCSFIDDYGHDLIIKSVYGLKVKPDHNRERKVAELKKAMGDKYLLATPIQRKKND